jgi:hypothetical protein
MIRPGSNAAAGHSWVLISRLTSGAVVSVGHGMITCASAMRVDIHEVFLTFGGVPEIHQGVPIFRQDDDAGRNEVHPRSSLGALMS